MRFHFLLQATHPHQHLPVYPFCLQFLFGGNICWVFHEEMKGDIIGPLSQDLYELSAHTCHLPIGVEHEVV